MFGDGNQVVDHLISVFAHHVEWIDTHRIVGIREIDQHHVVPLTWGKEPAQRVHHIAVWLDEGQTWSSCTLSVGSLSAYRLRQVLEERTFALAGAGDGQQVVPQAFLW